MSKRPASELASGPASQPASQPAFLETSEKSLFISHMKIFVTALLALKLHERSDWPSITLTTFVINNVLQNQKNRTRCIEWALYRLFEIWDPKQTKEVSISIRPMNELRIIPETDNGALFSPSIPASIREASNGLFQGFQPTEDTGDFPAADQYSEVNVRRIQRR